MTTPPRDDSDLSQLFDDAVSGVHPAEGLDRIRDRATRKPASRWVPLTVGAAAATVLVIGGAAWFAGQQPDGSVAAGAPKGSTGGGSTAQVRTIAVPAYYVGDTAAGPRLFSEQHRVGVTGTALQAAVDQAMGSPADPDYRSEFRDLGATATATEHDGAVTIDLSQPVARPGGMDQETADAALQSLVWTADAAISGNGPVTFTVDGQPASQVLGIDTAAPVERAGADSVLSTVSITSPVEGDIVPSHFQVSGQAATFEANVVWELKQGDTTVRHGFTTAQECCTLSPYTFVVNAPPGDYTLVVHDTDESDGEGVGTSQDTKQIHVQ